MEITRTPLKYNPTLKYDFFNQSQKKLGTLQCQFRSGNRNVILLKRWLI